jgi:hypothetical protein
MGIPDGYWTDAAPAIIDKADTAVEPLKGRDA